VTLQFEAARVACPLAAPFRIARGETTTAEGVVVRVRERDRGATDGETTGVGAALPSRRYGETPATVEAVLGDLASAVADHDPRDRVGVDRALADAVTGHPAARAAVSTAVHDLVARRLELSLARLFGLDPAGAPRSSYSLGIADPETAAERAREAVAAGHRVLKLKVGDDRDRERVERVRAAAPEARLRVDANEAWRPRVAVERCRALAAFDVEFVEQPVPADDREGLRRVYERSPVPVAVDEAVRGPADVPGVADRADVVVAKVEKCGGPRRALRTVEAAQDHGLSAMVGCMVGTAAGVAASAAVAPAAEFADVDGSLLLATDPYDGPVREDGRVVLDERPGTEAVAVDPPAFDAV
jgi:L-alanine-DL-glutamate epimerase-like enolase superfamily enzyme